ncbi:MAG TPA: hypothetical protein VN456_18505 [Desulfosporosinus sp.]|nr:hypothetical protein [Desulfosporosinus sp.]
MSNKDEAKREVLASELGQLKEKYAQLEQNFSELKRQAFLNETQGLVPAQWQQTPPKAEEPGQGQTS